jgi:ribose-phosphate pyrophosphokinase
VNSIYKKKEQIELTWPIRNPKELIELLEISNALNHLQAQKCILNIPYLMAARSDRHMQHGDSADLQIIAQLINSCKFQEINILDPHSDVSLMLIDHSYPTSNQFLLDQYYLPNSVLIVPDAGAAKKHIKHPMIDQTVQCIKERDSRGKISLRLLEPNICIDRHCVVVDDLCDGGATFLAIAEQIPHPEYLTLIVTHGVFSKGFDKLFEKYNQIITSNSFQDFPRTNKLTVISIPF